MKKIILFCILSCMAHLYAYSQDVNSKLIQRLVDKEVLTKDEADELKAEIEADQIKEASKNSLTDKVDNVERFIRKGFNTPYLNFGGYGMLTYQYDDDANVKQDLRTRVALLWMQGKFGDHFGYMLMNDFADSGLLEYYAEWMPARSFNLRAGQFKVPFTLENPLSLTVIESVPNTRSVASLSGQALDVGVNNGGGRDMGIQASGSFLKVGQRDLVYYAVGIFQGRGINARDNNNTKDFAGTLIVEPSAGFRLAGGLYAGQSRYVFKNSDVIEDHVRNRWALSADYSISRFNIRAEWLHGKDGGIKREGLYGLAQWYFMPKKWSTFAKVDHYYTDKDAGSKVIDYMIGTNYYFFKNSRFQLNYQFSDYSKWAGQSTTNTVYAQLQVVF